MGESEVKGTDSIVYSINNGLGQKVGEAILPFRDAEVDTLLKTIAKLKHRLAERDLKFEKIKDYLKCID